MLEDVGQEPEEFITPTCCKARPSKTVTGAVPCDTTHKGGQCLEQSWKWNVSPWMSILHYTCPLPLLFQGVELH